MGKIVLASSSPRRAEILKRAKYKFEVIPSLYVEDHTTTDFSYSFIEDLAYNKAKGVLSLLKAPSIVVGADTVVVLDAKILGKPKDEQDAFCMLKKLSGRKHFVVTSIAVINSKTLEVKKNSTTSFVEFSTLTDEQITEYIDKFRPLDKAGSYGIQEMPDGYIKSYDGSFENIMGICSKSLAELLSGFGE